MDQWIAFAQEQWYVIAIAVVALFIIYKIVKKAIKWALIIAIVVAVLIYGFNYDLSDLPEIPNINVEQYLN